MLSVTTLSSRVYDAQSFTLLTDPQSIMAIGLRFMTSKVMERVPVADWKTEWEVSLIIEALKECYPLTTSDNLVSTYEKWYKLYKSMRKTITVDQYNIALTRKQFSEQLIAALADYGEIPTEHEATLLSKFVSVFTNFHNPHKEYGSNRLFHNDLKEALEKDAAYTAAPSLQGLKRGRRMLSALYNVPSLMPTRSARVRSLPPPREASAVALTARPAPTH